MPRRRLLRSHAKTERFNPLLALASASMKRPARASYLPPAKRRKVAPRTAKHKAKGRIQKIGSYAGQLIASKPVGIPKAGARVRQRVFGDSGSAVDKAWLFGSNMGNEKFYCGLAAQALVTHMLREIKDFRSDKGSKVSGSVYKYQVTFSQDDNVLASGAPKQMVMFCTADSSFNGMVYNPLGALGNTVEIDGTPVSVVVERNLVAQLFLQALQGYYPSGIAVNRDAFTTDSWVYRDTQFGQAQLSMSIKSDFKYQNITPASAGDASTNINAIDANPLQGKIATFRNQSLTWNKGWLAQQAPLDQNTLTNFSGRPSDLDDWDYKQTSVFPFTTVTSEQAAMPLRMRTVFANAKTSTPVYFPPGGFKVFKTTFTYKGTMVRFLRDSIQQGAETTPQGKYPPMGDSFALCLVPTMKSQLLEPVKVAFDIHRDGQAHMTRYRGGTLPTTNQIE